MFLEMVHYHGKIFRVLVNSSNGEVGPDLRFHYCQEGDLLSCSYSGGRIVKGHLIGIVAADGSIDMRYHQVNQHGELMTGVCKSTPEWTAEGKLRLHEQWEWTSGDCSKGSSTLEEV
jgi:hypothetical protein